MDKIQQLRSDLITVRNEKGVSQQWLANQHHISQSAISRFESGESRGTGPLRKALQEFVDANRLAPCVQDTQNIGEGQ